MATKQKIIIKSLLRDTYLAAIKNSVGSKMWRHFYATIGGKKTDIMRGGDLSCAFFVSSILALLGLIKKPHITVDGTIRDMKSSGWRMIKKPEIGSVLVWVPKIGASDNAHRHIGFYIGDNKAISNSSKRRMPIVHHWTFGIKRHKPTRPVETILWYTKW